MTAKQRIYHEIRREIITGKLKPGQRLDLDHLAEKHNTSITPVREALHLLSNEGLVTSKPHSGYFVTRITLKQLRDLFELRRILELAAVVRAAERITAKEIEELRHVHAGYTGEEKPEDTERYFSENRQFHYLIASASGNQELANEIGHIHDRLARYMAIRAAGATMEENHIRIVDGLERHDAEAAKAFLENEVVEMSKVVIERLVSAQEADWVLEV